MLPPAVLFTEDGYMHRILRRRKEARVLLIKGGTYLARGARPEVAVRYFLPITNETTQSIISNTAAIVPSWGSSTGATEKT